MMEVNVDNGTGISKLTWRRLHVVDVALFHLDNLELLSSVNFPASSARLFMLIV